MRPGQFVTLKQVDAAAMAVQTELDRLGVWQADSRLRRTDIMWCPLPQMLYAALGLLFRRPARRAVAVAGV